MNEKSENAVWKGTCALNEIGCVKRFYITSTSNEIPELFVACFWFVVVNGNHACIYPLISTIRTLHLKYSHVCWLRLNAMISLKMILFIFFLCLHNFKKKKKFNFAIAILVKFRLANKLRLRPFKINNNKNFSPSKLFPVCQFTWHCCAFFRLISSTKLYLTPKLAVHLKKPLHKVLSGTYSIAVYWIDRKPFW